MKRLLRYRSFLLRGVILLLPLFSFFLAAIIRFVILHGELDRDQHVNYLFLLLLAMVVWSIAIEHYGVGSMQHVMARTYMRFAGIRACAVTYVILLALLFFWRPFSFSRLFLVVTCICQVLLTIATLAFARIMHKQRIASGEHLHVLVIGADEFATRIAERLSHSRILRCSIFGYVPLDRQIVAVKDEEIIEFNQVKSLAFGSEIDDIVVALPPERLPELAAIRESLSSLPIPVRAVLDLGDSVQLEGNMFRFDDLQMLDLHPGPSESLIYLLLKRAFDLAFASVALIVTAPVSLTIAAIIRITSPGPVLFVQQRVGLNGRLFRMYKFRTMKTGVGADSDVRWTVENDPRCTVFGSLLRKTSLDELPQFLNVLKGDMSVVGPRPERPYYVSKFGKELRTYHSRHQLKVGITGWAQVNGLRGDSSISERLAHDLYYLQNWSLGFDLQIIFLTMLRGLLGRNAY